MKCTGCGSTDVELKTPDWGICKKCGSLVESDEIQRQRENVARAFRKLGHPLPGDPRAGTEN